MSIQNDNTIIFLHVAKAGGSTLRRVLRNQYSNKEVYEIVSRGRKTEYNIQKFITLPEEEKRQIKLLQGHFSYGLHNHIFNKCKYISMLRDPVNRVLSGFNYASSNPNHFLFDKLKGMSLTDYLNSDIIDVDRNRAVQRLSGIPMGQEITLETLFLAKKNIENDFVAVGLMERFDESLILFQSLLGWKSIPVYSKLNVSKSSPQDPTSCELEKIKLLYSLDMELYKWVRMNFEDKVDKPDFNLSSKLKEFQKSQNIYNKSWQAYALKISEQVKAGMKNIREKYHNK